MAQPSVAAFFNTRKRAALDDAASIKNRRTNDLDEDSDNFSTSSMDNIAPYKAAGTTTGVRTRSGRLVKRTGIQNPADIVVPKKVSRKAKTAKEANEFTQTTDEIKATPQKTEQCESVVVLQKANEATPSTNAAGKAALHTLLASKHTTASMETILRTPTKQIIKGSGKTPIKHTSGELLNLVKKELNFDEVKTKLSRSEKLQELKASLSRIQELEKTRKLQEERNRRLKENLLSPAKKVTEPAVQLKEFDKIELEVLTR